MKPDKNTFEFLSVKLIDRHPDNPRGEVNAEEVTELADSIREAGIIEPLIVVADGSRWRLVCGERRLAAARLAGLDRVPAVVRELTPPQQYDWMVIENLQRKDLNPLQEARALLRLKEIHQTINDVARVTGAAPNFIVLRLRILKLSERVQELFNSFEMPLTAVPLLLEVASPDRQLTLAQRLSTRRLSVPELKATVNRMKAEKADAAEKAPRRERQMPFAHGITQPQALDLLKGDGTFTSAEVSTALRKVCAECGMKNHDTVCQACPAPQMIQHLLRPELTVLKKGA